MAQVLYQVDDFVNIPFLVVAGTGFALQVGDGLTAVIHGPAEPECAGVTKVLWIVFVVPKDFSSYQAINRIRSFVMLTGIIGR